MTFMEAYQRTGRILNISCVPSDPHSPTILANYLTSPDCVIWSTVIASAAVPGILNPVVLMRKNREGKLEPYSFGHKWKDGSLRTDIPLKALNLHFNVNFTIVSQVNPHINLFFFSSRGTVGRPVTHRRGRGWRGGFLGSATEQYLKLDLRKWLKVLRHLELLPRPMGQDWSQLWLQRFSGTITIWPKSIPTDYYYILSDPTPQRLARMIHVGQLSTWPKLKFIANRMKLERMIDQGRKNSRPQKPGLASVLSDDDIKGLLAGNASTRSLVRRRIMSSGSSSSDTAKKTDRSKKLSSKTNTNKPLPRTPSGAESPTLTSRVKSWFRRDSDKITRSQSAVDVSSSSQSEKTSHAVYASAHHSRRGSTFMEMARQSQVFFDDDDFDDDVSEEEKKRRKRNSEYRVFSDPEAEEEDIGSDSDFVADGDREVFDSESEDEARLQAAGPTRIG